MDKTKKIKVIRRQATLADAKEIFELDLKVWKDFPGTFEMFSSRIATFPEGQLVALVDGKIVGYLGIQFIHLDIDNFKPFTWGEITDNGTMKNSHNYQGDCLYGVAMTVDPDFQGYGIGTKLALSGWAVQIKYNIKWCLIGSRIPGYQKYSGKMKVEEYIKMTREDGMPYDPELRMWRREGYHPIKVLPGYINDPESMHYGVLVYRKSPFYNWPFRNFWAYVLRTFGPKFIRSGF